MFAADQNTHSALVTEQWHMTKTTVHWTSFFLHFNYHLKIKNHV